ncbi:MAG: HEAT repeat domain-containing protein, partial [Myxococcota bacterium]
LHVEVHHTQKESSGAVDVVPTRAQLDANWTHADQRLMQAATDPTRDIWRRARALSLLSFYPTDTTRAFLLRMMDLNVEPRLRQVATYTLGLTFGTPGDPELVAQMVTMTQDPDDKVRRRAVRTLRWIDHPNAEDALKAIAKGSADDELSKLAAYVLQRRHDRLGK